MKKKIKLYLIYLYCKIRNFSNYKTRIIITKSNNGFWGDILRTNVYGVEIRPRKLFGQSWIGVLFVDKYNKNEEYAEHFNCIESKTPVSTISTICDKITRNCIIDYSDLKEKK